MRSILEEVLRAASGIYSGWILWNLFLASIPLVLSFWLFRRKSTSRSFPWWLGFVVYAAFLPNAPYLLTDIIHLIRGVREGYSAWVIALIFIPIHLAAILGGFVAYVISLINQDYYLKRLGAGRFILWVELLTHLLCAVGIYLGRFRRFNSWDLVTDPSYIFLSTLNDLTSKRPLVVIVIIFAVLTVFYWLVKQITLGLKLRIQYARQGIDVIE